MQNKRLLIPTIAALIISISCFLYVKYSLDQQVHEKVETQMNQSEEENPDIIGLGFSDINILQRLGSTFRFITSIK